MFIKRWNRAVFVEVQKSVLQQLNDLGGQAEIQLHAFLNVFGSGS